MNRIFRNAWGRRATIGLLAALLLPAGEVPAAPAGASNGTDALQSISKGFTSVARKTMPAVVFIRVEKTMRMPGMQRGAPRYNDPYGFFGDEFLQRFFGDQAPQQRRRLPREFLQKGQGSGFLITKDGYLLTNNHVVGDADKITVKLHDGREFQARRIGSDPKSEVALIKIEGNDFPYIELGDSDAMEIGEWVIAVGNPFGLSATLTVGVISAKGRSNIGIADYEDFIQTDAAINPGNSGGPLLNVEGKVVGINTAIYSQTGGSMGIGFAIPVNMARSVKEQLMKTGKVVRGQIGIVIQPVTRELAGSFGLDKAEGLLVADVVKDSAGEKAGLKQGDVILKLNGRPADAVAAFRNEIAMTAPGTAVTLTVFRDKGSRAIKVTIGELAGEEAEGGQDPAAAVPTADDVAANLGISVGEVTPALAERIGMENAEGVIVMDVTDGSPAADAGIEPGMLIAAVNQKRIRNLAEFNKALSESSKTKTALFLIRTSEGSRFVALTVK